MSFLGLFGGPPNVDKLKARGNIKGLIKALDYHDDEAIRKSAAKALAWLGDERAIDPLTAIAENKQEQSTLRKMASSSITIIKFLYGALNDQANLAHRFKMADIPQIYYFLALGYRKKPGFNSRRTVEYIEANLSGECPKCGLYIRGDTITTAAAMQEQSSRVMFLGGGDAARLAARKCPSEYCNSQSIDLFWRR
jgi:hypothetical protein